MSPAIKWTTKLVGLPHQMGKFLREIHLDMFRVVGFKGPIVRLVKMNENRHHLTWPELACSLSLLACRQLSSFPLWSKVEHEIIDSAKQFE
jgi:hypothetical protein